ncbi:hypothetical protein BB560_006048, partial [Smittium megazygosporum]
VAKEKGIRNILVLRGDEPLTQTDALDDTPKDVGGSRFQYASELVRYIRSKDAYKNFFNIGVAGHPEGYINSNFPTDKEQDHSSISTSCGQGSNIGKEKVSETHKKFDKELREIMCLKDKVNEGADFILSQIFYNTENFIKWYIKCKSIGINVPIIPTLLPIQTYSSFQRIVKLTGIQVPEKLQERLSLVKHDDKLVKSIGVEYCIEQVNTISSMLGVANFHFATLNLEMSVSKVLTKSGLLDLTDKENLNDNSDSVANILLGQGFGVASSSSQDGIDKRKAQILWDEYPNSRWGDARSPSFFNETLYGQYGSMVSELGSWGVPKTEADINELFRGYVNKQKLSLPWTNDSIEVFDTKHKAVLEKMCLNGLWVLASQYGIDGVSSSDKEYGWGPENGYVYQRSFVEFFVRKPLLLKLAKFLNIHKKEISFYAATFGDRSSQQNGDAFAGVSGDGNALGTGEQEDQKVHIITSRSKGKELSDELFQEDLLPSEISQVVIESKEEKALNIAGGDEACGYAASENSNENEEIESTVLTWGVFPHKIVQAALIDRLNFGFWSKEAIQVWHVWSKLMEYRNRTSSGFLGQVADDVWLVNVIGNDYKHPYELFELLEKFTL